MVIFSFNFDMSSYGNPSNLSLEATMYCWASGSDDSGWQLIASNENSKDEPWISIPLTNVGPNIELVDVNFEGDIKPNSDIRIEITVKNTGESLSTSFNVSVYILKDGIKTKVGNYNQGPINNGQGAVKRILITIPDGEWELEVYVDSAQKICE